MAKGDTELLFGIDLGGTKIECIVLDSQDLKTICRKRVLTEGDKGYEHVLRRIHSLVLELEHHSGAKAKQLGICTPGTLDPDTFRIKNSNSVHLNGQPMKKDLEELIKVPVFMANDANCFAAAEYHLGVVAEEMPEAKIVFGVIIGTGVGGGVVVNGEVLYGRHGISGEWGHNVIKPGGKTCYCGKEGCIETVISGPALAAYYAERSGVERALEEIAQLARTGKDLIAEDTISRLIDYFGSAISVVINILDPDAVVIGGGVGNIEAIYERIDYEVQKHVFNYTLKTRFLKPRLGDSAGVFGAALLPRNSKMKSLL